MNQLTDTELKGDILVVDDLVDNVRLLSMLLSQQGYKVRKALSGTLAIQAAQVSPPDLILLDILMPEMNGFEVCQKLKSHEKTVEIPVIFLSALSEAFDKVRAFEVGGVDYISKPFQIEEVMARIEHQLRIQRLQKQLAEKNIQLQREIEERQHAEVALRQLNATLESKVQERTIELVETNQHLQSALRHKELLLQEVHHRVKNNLQIISSLISLQAKHPKQDVNTMLMDVRQRIRTIALVHEQLNQPEEIEEIEFAEYVGKLTRNLMQSYRINLQLIQLEQHIPGVCLNLEQAVPCGLLINELVSNALAHAFPNGRSGRVQIHLASTENNHFTLQVSDDGVGFLEAWDLQNSSTLGMRLVEALTQQLHGTWSIQHDRGTIVTITFPQLTK